jgi:hypothetical protein
MLFVRKRRSSLKGNSLNNIVIFKNAFHSTPKIELLKVIFLTELEHGYLKIDSFFSRKSLTDAVDELQFRSDICNIHVSAIIVI